MLMQHGQRRKNRNQGVLFDGTAPCSILSTPIRRHLTLFGEMGIPWDIGELSSTTPQLV